MFEDSRVIDPAAEFRALAAAIAAIPARPDPGTAAVVITAQTRALITLTRQVEARLLSWVAAIDTQGLAEGDGFGSTNAWVRGYTTLDTGQAAALVHAARLADRLPSLGQAAAAGTVGREHLTAIARGARRLPEAVLASHEFTLRNVAGTLRPSDLRRVTEKIQACHDHDAVTADAAHAYDARGVTLSPTFGGAHVIDGLLDPEGGASLRAALESLMTRRGPEDTRSASQRRADALVEMAQRALRTGDLPETGGDRPRLTFLVRTDTTSPAHHTPATAEHPDEMDAHQAAPDPQATVAGSPQLDAVLAGVIHRMLHHPAGTVTGTGTGAQLAGSQLLPDPPAPGQPGAARLPATVFTGEHQLLGAPTLLPTTTVERICCDASIGLSLLDRWDEPLNHGRTTRSHTPAQGRAVTARDRHCVFPDCDAPPARCQVHHLIFWSQHGKTDLINLALVCWFHHHLIHEGGWRLQRIPPQHGDDHGDRGDHNSTAQPPGWLAISPTGRQLRQYRQPAA